MDSIAHSHKRSLVSFTLSSNNISNSSSRYVWTCSTHGWRLHPRPSIAFVKIFLRHIPHRLFCTLPCNTFPSSDISCSKNSSRSRHHLNALLRFVFLDLESVFRNMLRDSGLLTALNAIKASIPDDSSSWNTHMMNLRRSVCVDKFYRRRLDAMTWRALFPCTFLVYKCECWCNIQHFLERSYWASKYHVRKLEWVLLSSRTPWNNVSNCDLKRRNKSPDHCSELLGLQTQA